MADRSWVGEMSVEAEKRVALVTGGGGGIGIATCRALCDTGVRVIIGDLLAERAQQAAASLRAEGFDATAAVIDVSERASVDRVFDEILSAHGRLDILANLAGVVRNDLIAKIKDQDFDLTIASHLRGTLNCIRAAIPTMRKQRYGRIVNMSSVAALGTIGGASYGAAKGAIESMARTAARELAADNITVNCVAPGLIRAGMFLTTPQQFQAAGIERTPMKRAGSPEEVAACIAFFASSAASFVTGQTLYVCGGLSVGF